MSMGIYNRTAVVKDVLVTIHTTLRFSSYWHHPFQVSTLDEPFAAVTASSVHGQVSITLDTGILLCKTAPPAQSGCEDIMSERPLFKPRHEFSIGLRPDLASSHCCSLAIPAQLPLYVWGHRLVGKHIFPNVTDAADCSRFSARISPNLAVFLCSSKLPGRAGKKPPHSVMLPPLCLTVGICCVWLMPNILFDGHKVQMWCRPVTPSSNCLQSLCLFCLSCRVFLLATLP